MKNIEFDFNKKNYVLLTEPMIPLGKEERVPH
jgi:hypothetical protein